MHTFMQTMRLHRASMQHTNVATVDSRNHIELHDLFSTERNFVLVTTTLYRLEKNKKGNN
jgi:hypothetical protein